VDFYIVLYRNNGNKMIIGNIGQFVADLAIRGRGKNIATGENFSLPTTGKLSIEQGAHLLGIITSLGDQLTWRDTQNLLCLRNKLRKFRGNEKLVEKINKTLSRLDLLSYFLDISEQILEDLLASDLKGLCSLAQTNKANYSRVKNFVVFKINTYKISLNILGVRTTEQLLAFIKTLCSDLTYLEVQGLTLTEEKLTPLIQHLPKLQEIHLTFASIGSSGAQAIANTPYERHFKNLQRIFDNTGLSGEQVIANVPLIQKLIMLNLVNNHIGLKSAQGTAISPHMHDLTVLNLAHNDIGSEGVVSFANSSHMQNLTTLILESNKLGPAEAQAIANSENMQNLTILNLANNNIGSDGAAAIANSSYMRNLSTLHLAQSRICPEGVVAIANSPFMQNLINLYLRKNTIGSDGVTAIAYSPHMKNLAVLELSLKGIGPNGVQVILRSPHMQKIAIVHLDLNKLSFGVGRAIQALYSSLNFQD